ncbi:hypothetical protein LR48_Vigan01g272800 [Vigna angularis]|uniref:Uncharacterized protein n=1 Tax=Phaseolus angularis TaxID=3914 RepID=A0A0L9TRV8_PHAAN|nr:hypothetical protein LR48_Vigan01g272800 [Vigna angularis]
MADSVVSIQYLKDFFNSQIYDDEKWAFNVIGLIAMSSNETARVCTLFLFDTGEWNQAMVPRVF